MLLSRSQNDWEILVAHNTASIGVPGYFPTYAFAGPLLSLYVSTHISSTSFSLDFPIPGRKLCSLNMNINYRMRMRLVQVLSSDLSSAQDVYSENGKVVRRAAVEALVRELVDKYGFRLRLQKAVRSHKGAYRLKMGTPRKNARDATQHVYLAGRRTAYYAKSFMLLAQNIRASSDSRISSLPRSQNCRAASRASSQTSNVFAVACGSISSRGGTWPSAVGAYSIET